jgi:methionyl-tRNA formyltransferase
MKIIFMGTPDFAVPTLEALLKNNYEIVAVVTAPDKPAGRGQQIQQTAVKKFASDNNLLVLQPEKLKSAEFINTLKLLQADLQIVVAFRMLPEEVWNMPRLGTYNLHASLLPNYRGAAPINWALINGEKKTGATVFKLKHEIDTGNILSSFKIELSDNITAGELHDILMIEGAKLMIEAVNKIQQGSLQLTDQTNILGEWKHAPKIFKEDCKINWSNNPDQIHNLIRGLSPYPAAWTEFNDKNNQLTSIKIYRTTKESINHNLVPGSIITDNKNYLKVACKQGFLNIEELQIAGKKKLQVKELLKGYHFQNQTIFI